MSEEIEKELYNLRNHVVLYLKSETEETRHLASEVYLSLGNILKKVIKSDEVKDKPVNGEAPIWKFEKVELTYLRPVIKGGKKSTTSCYASIDFGFFRVDDIGITRHDMDNLSWNPAFGWSHFHFNDTYIGNPLGDEVRKLEMMVKDELHRKRSQIIDFLNDPSTMPIITKGAQQ